MKIRNTSICALALLATGALDATAALAQASEMALHAGSLEVPVNKSQVVTANRPISKAMIGNAEVADVLPISERSVYVLGKQFGTTSLTLYDRANRVIAVMDVAVGPDTDGLRRQLSQHLPGQDIKVQLSNGSLLLTGMVNDAGAADRAMQLARGFAGDKVINLLAMGGSQQVMLEVRFAEVNRQAGIDLGVRSTGTSDNGSFNFAIGSGASYAPARSTSTTTVENENGVITSTSATSTSPAAIAVGAVNNTFGILAKSFGIGNVNINSTLDALERKGLSKTLAEPTLIALSGERASFLAGGEYPVPVAGFASATATGGLAVDRVSIQFKPFGVSLGFTPTVLADKVISLIVEPEVSSLDPTASVSANGITVPGLRTRRARTTVELRDGESFAIAGLLSSDFQTTVRQFPLLGSLPIIGSLFRSSGFQKGETELLIVVTPRLVSPIRPEQVRLPTDRIEDPRAVDVLIDGEGYRPRALAPMPKAMRPADDAAAPPPAAPPQDLPVDPPVSGLSSDSTPSKQEQGYEF